LQVTVSFALAAASPRTVTMNSNPSVVNVHRQSPFPPTPPGQSRTDDFECCRLRGLRLPHCAGCNRRVGLYDSDASGDVCGCGRTEDGDDGHIFRRAART
jgi:hypothetical protein